jgi:hypothetical protein
VCIVGANNPGAPSGIPGPAAAFSASKAASLHMSIG